ncbi:hypothetical protein KR009_007573, partial [Drosophila setifemur]
FKSSFLFVVLLLAIHLEASKIAYKKPLFGKGNFIKEKRVRSKGSKVETTTMSTTSTTEEFWPAPVEFVIVTTPKTELESSSEWANRSSTTPETVTTGSVQIREGGSSGSGEVAAPPPTAGEVSTDSATDPIISTTPSSGLVNTLPSPPIPVVQDNYPVPCTCGVFLSSQIPNGLPTAPLIHQELDRMFPCNAIGQKQCQTKCLEAIVQHLPNSANIVCSALGHDCHKQRAYLFIKNCHNQWVNTNLQAGREYCCRSGLPYRCPLIG